MPNYGSMSSSVSGFFAIIVLLGFAVLAFDVWMLVDAIQRPPEQYPSPDQKTVWIIGLIVGLATAFPAIIVAIAYYVIVRKPAGPPRPVAWSPPPQGYGAPPTPGTPPPAAPPPPAGAAAPPLLNCRNCGAKLIAGARFCHSCGAVV